MPSYIHISAVWAWRNDLASQNQGCLAGSLSPHLEAVRLAINIQDDYHQSVGLISPMMGLWVQVNQKDRERWQLGKTWTTGIESNSTTYCMSSASTLHEKDSLHGGLSLKQVYFIYWWLHLICTDMHDFISLWCSKYLNTYIKVINAYWNCICTIWNR